MSRVPETLLDTGWRSIDRKVGTLLAKAGSVVMASILATGRVYKGMPTRFQHEIFKPLQPAVGHRNDC